MLSRKIKNFRRDKMNRDKELQAHKDFYLLTMLMP